jgi:hypothetical protein
MRHRPAAAAVAIAALCLLLPACAPASATSPPAAPPSAASAPATSAPAGSAPAAPTPTPSTAAPSPRAASTTFAIIGDYGRGDSHEAAVADLVASWDPAFIIAVGDDYYSEAGGTGTGKYDESTGAYYCRWLTDVTTTGRLCPSGHAPVNAFFPAMGNHEYSDATPAPETYLTYFTLPGAGLPNTSGNERYYDYVQGPIHFFVLNSNPEEPDGTSSTSRQAQWLKAQLAASTSAWNIVYDHHLLLRHQARLHHRAALALRQVGRRRGPLRPLPHLRADHAGRHRLLRQRPGRRPPLRLRLTGCRQRGAV